MRTGRRAAAAFAARHGVEDQGAVQTAVGEALANSVVHAYRDRELAGEVLELSAVVEAEAVCIVVTDRGMGLRPRTDSPGAGVGLLLMSRLSTSFEVDELAGGGTVVRLRFARAGAGGAR